MKALPTPSPTKPRIVSAIEWPPFRTDIKVLPKSCTPPTKIDPTKIHAQVGPHPKYIAAKMGPNWTCPSDGRKMVPKQTMPG